MSEGTIAALALYYYMINFLVLCMYLVTVIIL